jgi:hypothetical protein
MALYRQNTITGISNSFMASLNIFSSLRASPYYFIKPKVNKDVGKSNDFLMIQNIFTVKLRNINLEHTIFTSHIASICNPAKPSVRIFSND